MFSKEKKTHPRLVDIAHILALLLLVVGGFLLGRMTTEDRERARLRREHHARLVVEFEESRTRFLRLQDQLRESSRAREREERLLRDRLDRLDRELSRIRELNGDPAE
jgi:Tfp pilus assembly protein PilN